MTRKQRVTVYAVFVFMILWGFDLLDLLKTYGTVKVESLFHPFLFSQLIYVTGTLAATDWLFRRYYLKKEYLRLAAGLVLLIFFFIVLRYGIEEGLYRWLWNFGNYNRGVSPVYYAIDNLYYVSIYIIFGVVLFLFDQQLRSQKDQALLLAKSKEAELLFLRSQINPHFLFNTLNNIYSLVYERSEKAPDAILQLAGLMRYLLYERGEKVSLQREWDYLQSFIELQRLRFNHPVVIESKLKGNPETCEVMPNLLISFVENAFKHGDFRDPCSVLRLHLECGNGSVSFTATNRIGHHQRDATGGVGLENIRRRLELVYPDRHQLVIREEGGFYTSILTLTVEQHDPVPDR